MKILAQIVECLECGKRIQSRFGHDYQICGCDNHAMVDGGTEYSRYGAKDMNMIKHSIVTTEDPHEIIRKSFYWGRNYDRNKNRLPITEWVHLKDLTTDHISSIINGEHAKGEILNVFLNELTYRHENEIQ